MDPVTDDADDLIDALHARATLDDLDAYYVFGYLLYADLALTPEGGWMRKALEAMAAKGQAWAAALAAAIETPPTTLEGAEKVLPAWRDRVRGWQARARAAMGEIPPALAWYRAGADRGHVGCLQAWGSMLAHEAKDPEALAAAFAAVHEAAVAGNASARYRLAWLYREGKGTTRDFEEADRWFKAACEAGQPDALVEALVAEIVEHGYEPGPGTEARLQALMALGSPTAYFGMGLVMRIAPDADPAEIFRYFDLAATLGMPQARWETGLARATGDGAPLDPARGIAEMREAGERDPSYLTMLAERLLAGLDDMPDPEEGVRLLERAMAAGDLRARWRLAEHLREGEDPARALVLMREAAEQGFAEAQYGLAEMYDGGEGVAADPVAARGWLERAATQDHVFALWELGRRHEDGLEGVEADPALAFEYFQRAAEQGMSVAQNSVGRLYRDGVGVEPDVVVAASWFELAAEQGLPLAQYNLGCLIAEHDEVEGGPEEAVRWWLAAAEQDLPWAQAAVGRAYHLGEGVPENLEMAAHWYERAAEGGDEGAAEALAALRARSGDQLEARARLERAWAQEP